MNARNQTNLQIIFPNISKPFQNAPKFEELFYQHNKYIVYGLSRKKLISQNQSTNSVKRPKTGYSVDYKLKSRLESRNKASIQKFIFNKRKNYQETIKHGYYLDKGKFDSKQRNWQFPNKDEKQNEKQLKVKQIKTLSKLQKSSSVKDIKRKVKQAKAQNMSQIRPVQLGNNRDNGGKLNGIRTLSSLQQKRQNVQQIFKKQPSTIEQGEKNQMCQFNYQIEQNNVLDKQNQKNEALQSSQNAQKKEQNSNKNIIDQQEQGTALKDSRYLFNPITILYKENDIFKVRKQTIYNCQDNLDLLSNQAKQFLLNNDEKKAQQCQDFEDSLPQLSNLSENNKLQDLAQVQNNEKKPIPQDSCSFRKTCQSPQNRLEEVGFFNKQENHKNLSGQGLKYSFANIRNLKKSKGLNSCSPIKQKLKKNNLSFQTPLKRAKICQFLVSNFYSPLIKKYEFLINQKPNSNLVKTSQHEQNQKNTRGTQSLKSIKRYHFNRSKVLLTENSQLSAIQGGPHSINDIFIDFQFRHTQQLLQEQDVYWIYFKPSPQSSIFPQNIQYLNHYLTFEQNSSSKPLLTELIQLLNCLLTCSAELIQRLFEPSCKNVFSCWLFVDNHFQPFFVDGYLPYDRNLNTFFTKGLNGGNQEFLWVGILIKCIAKAIGGYQKLKSLKFQDFYEIITGLNFHKVEHFFEQTREEQTQEQQKRVVQKIRNKLIKSVKLQSSKVYLKNLKQESICLLLTGIKDKKFYFKGLKKNNQEYQISYKELIQGKNLFLFLMPLSRRIYTYTQFIFPSQKEGTLFNLNIRFVKTKIVIRVMVLLNSRQSQFENWFKSCSPEILVYDKENKNNKKKTEQQFSEPANPSFLQLNSKQFVKIDGHQNKKYYQKQIMFFGKGKYEIVVACNNTNKEERDLKNNIFNYCSLPGHMSIFTINTTKQVTLTKNYC